jgi:hypothetical protein
MGNSKRLKRTVLQVAQLNDNPPCDNSPLVTSLIPTSVAVIYDACMPPSATCVFVSPGRNLLTFRPNIPLPLSGYKTEGYIWSQHLPPMAYVYGAT